ncbi:hypothetical protein KC347_g310 [Hortaea werneckii]|nr:hypothetical protein KC347_g310 [Hortaea werneckii]
MKDAIDSDWISWLSAELEHRKFWKCKADPVSIAASRSLLIAVTPAYELLTATNHRRSGPEGLSIPTLLSAG